MEYAAAQSGTGMKVGRIDGSVKDMKQRLNTLRKCSVVIMTPDVVHAWLLSECRREGRSFVSLPSQVDNRRRGTYVFWRFRQ